MLSSKCRNRSFAVALECAAIICSSTIRDRSPPERFSEPRYMLLKRLEETLIHSLHSKITCTIYKLANARVGSIHLDSNLPTHPEAHHGNIGGTSLMKGRT